MIEITSETDLNNLIQNRIEESQQLEYKSSLSLNDTKEISKDVSSMANSAGGIIIYGIKEFDIKEKNHLPEKIDPVNRSNHSREWLEQVINSNIQPQIKGLVISPIEINNNINSVVYIVNVPQSDTAHQAKDGKYYKRNNFIVNYMQDFEIRDIMNRNKNPKIILEFEIINYKFKKEIYHKTITGIPIPSTQDDSELSLIIRPKNIGKVYAKYISYHINIPIEFINKDRIFDDDCFDQNGKKYYSKKSNNIIFIKNGGYFYKTLLPNLYGNDIEVSLLKYLHIDDKEIYWTVYADNAQPSEGMLKLSEIEMIEKKVERSKFPSLT